MRVVCDNCGAVYKISSAKLVKDINRATCKRCGHKILISKRGNESADDADTAAPHGAGESEQVVVRSNPVLGSGPQPSVPSIGSLTAELRAITIPGIDGVGGKQSTGTARLGPDPSGSDGELTERRDLGGLPVAPAVRIPASDSPVTMAYGGPTAAGSAKIPAAAHASAAEPVTAGSAMSGMVSARKAPSPQEHAAKPRAQSAAPRAAVAGGGAVVLKAVAVCSGLGVLAMVATEFLTGAAAVAATAVSGIGLFGSLALATLTGLGARPERIPVALILGLVCGVALSAPSLVELGSTQSSPMTQTPPSVPGTVVGSTQDRSENPGGGEQLAEGEVADAGRDESPSVEGLSSEELEEARRFDAAAGAAPVEPAEAAAVEPAKSKGSKADVDPAAEAAQAAAAAVRVEEKRKRDADRREQRRQEEAERREEAKRREEVENTAAERRAEDKRGSGLGGPKRASLKKPEGSQTSSTASSGPKPFVIDTIIRNNGNIKRCLEAEVARGMDLSGKIFLQFTIAPNGGVSRAKLTTSRWAGTSLDTCISKQVNRLDFPPFEGRAKKIKYALVIQ